MIKTTKRVAHKKAQENAFKRGGEKVPFGGREGGRKPKGFTVEEEMEELEKEREATLDELSDHFSHKGGMK